MKRRKTQSRKVTKPQESHGFGPCHFCEWPMTHVLSNSGTAGQFVAICLWCHEKWLAIDGMLREPEHYVI